MSERPVSHGNRLSEEDDLALVRAFQRGSESAFKELVSRHQVRLYAFVWREVRNHADAADICQRTFLQVFLKAKGFRADAGFRTWLYQIAVNLCKNHFRSQARTPVDSVDLDTLAAHGAPDEPALAAHDRARLRAALEDLPMKQRTTLQLRFYQDCTFAEIADVMRCSVGTAKANYHHAVSNLRRKLQGTSL